jgi:hypothetical protein
METSSQAGLTMLWLGCIDAAASKHSAYSGQDRPTVRQRTDPRSAGRNLLAQIRAQGQVRQRRVPSGLDRRIDVGPGQLQPGGHLAQTGRALGRVAESIAASAAARPGKVATRNTSASRVAARLLRSLTPPAARHSRLMGGYRLSLRSRSRPSSSTRDRKDGLEHGREAASGRGDRHAGRGHGGTRGQTARPGLSDADRDRGTNPASSGRPQTERAK